MDKTFIKFNELYNIILNLKEQWGNSDEYGKSFIETIIGAGIYYLPITKKTHTGLISENGLLEPCNKLVKEHEFPRKISAKLLLESPPNTLDEFIELYYTKYGLWNLVTKKENTILRKFQKSNIFETPKLAYEKANIKLIKYDNKQSI
jgi:hypothetical protein